MCPSGLSLLQFIISVKCVKKDQTTFENLQQVSVYIIFLIIGFLNTLTPDDEYSRSNRKNLPLPIQRQLSEKLKTFSQLFITFLECTLNLEHFKKNEPHSSSISEVIDSERRAYFNA